MFQQEVRKKKSCTDCSTCSVKELSDLIQKTMMLLRNVAACKVATVQPCVSPSWNRSYYYYYYINREKQLCVICMTMITDATAANILLQGQHINRKAMGSKMRTFLLCSSTNSHYKHKPETQPII